MKADYNKHIATFLLYPSRTDVWRNNAEDIRKTVIRLCDVLSQFEPVYLGCDRDIITLPTSATTIKMFYNDIWVRDCGLIPTESGYTAFNFNAWGGSEGLYDDWSLDVTVCDQMSKILDVGYKKSCITLEGGNLTGDGEGTLILIENCVVNNNRNPDLSLEQIESYLKKDIDVSKIIWLKHGLVYDETGGHVDNLCAFVKPASVFLAWTDDEKNVQYNVVREAYEILSREVDAKGRKLNIVKIPLPEIFYRSDDDCVGLVLRDGSKKRLKGEPIQPSYINFIFVNGGVVVPQFGDKNDLPVLNIFKKFFDDRKVVAFNAREIVLGGGGLHCITKNI